MIRLFADERRALFAILVSVAIAELVATILVAETLHHSAHHRSLLKLGGATAAAFLFQVLQRRLSEGVGLSYTAAVRSVLFRHLMAADPEIVRSRKHGAMLLSFVGDLTALRQWVSDGVTRGILAIVGLVGMLSWVAYSRPALAFYLLAITTVVAAAGASLLPPLDRAVRTMRRERGRVSAFASERLTAQATVLTFGRGGSEAVKLDRRVDRMNRAALRRAWFTGVLRALPHLATTAMLAATVLAVPKQGAGALAGNVVIVGILGLALRDLARAGELMIPGRVSTARIQRLLSVPRSARPRGRSEKNVHESGLVIDRLAIGSGKTVWSARANPGDIILLSGPPQLRRQLFASLIGLSASARGSIRWDGVELLGLRRSRLRKFVGVTSPELPLLAGSSRRNIRYRATDLDDEEARRVAAYWGIESESGPIDAQRTSLARAVAGTPPLLLLDLAATPLQDDDLRRLVATLRTWPGVVILESEQLALQQLATRRWEVSPAGLLESSIAGSTLLRLVEEPAEPISA